MNKLNPQQMEAVRYVAGPLLVLAGAGSGKTSVITRKIAYLVEHCGIPSKNIAALTFTNKAAKEMKARVTKLIDSSDITVSTFHNLGLNIIRREYRTLGFKPGFSIMDQEDAGAILRDILLQDNGDSDLTNLIQNLISSWKNNLTSPEMALSKADSAGEQRAALAYAQYQRLLKAYNAVDFDDLILIPAQLFANNAEILVKWQKRIRYLLVDEYQDTNGAQYELVKQLIGDRSGLTVVGDDDQSIYTWRGANPENLALLQEAYPTLRVIKLEQNYRSTSRILKAANAVIANNSHIFEKKLWSELGHGEPIRIIQCANEGAELDRVAAEIIDQQMRYRRQFKDFAILYRGNHQARAMEIKLQQNQIPYSISGGQSFFARNEIKDIMAYFRLVVNPSDDAAFLRIINTPRRKIGPTTLEALGQYSNERQIPLYQACDEVGLTSRLPEQGLSRLHEFTRWLDTVRQQCNQQDPIAVLRSMIDTMNYSDWLHQNASSPAIADKRLQNIEILLDSVNHSLQKSDDESLEDAIARLVLRDLLDQQEEDQEENKVQMLTLHASKGLEFPHVFLIGFEENLLPHRNSIEEDNIEEERRLCYVGITRAQRSLTLTLAKQRKQWGDNIACTPSRFLDELPEDTIQKEGFGENCPERNEAKGKETLSSLRGLLSGF
jgi:ATP-dependent DNA helicase Rep